MRPYVDEAQRQQGGTTPSLLRVMSTQSWSRRCPFPSLPRRLTLLCTCHLCWNLTRGCLNSEVSVLFFKFASTMRTTGELQYWSFIRPGQCDKVVMLFCPLTVFHHFCLFQSFLVVASKAKIMKKCSTPFGPFCDPEMPQCQALLEF